MTMINQLSGNQVQQARETSEQEKPEVILNQISGQVKKQATKLQTYLSLAMFEVASIAFSSAPAYADEVVAEAPKVDYQQLQDAFLNPKSYDRLDAMGIRGLGLQFAENKPIPEVKSKPFDWSFNDASAALGKKAFRFAQDNSPTPDISKITGDGLPMAKSYAALGAEMPSFQSNILLIGLYGSIAGAALYFSYKKF